MLKNLLLCSMILFVTTQLMSAREDKKNGSGTSTPPSIESISYRSMQPNNVQAWFGNDARGFQTTADNAGFLWPAGTSRTAVFLASPWVAAQFEGNPLDIRTAAVQNVGRVGTEFIPGKILRSGDTLVPDDPNLEKYRIYRIARGDNAFTNSDYAQWPVADGAPTNSIGNPLITGSESMWFVANDLQNRRFSAQPLGCELQQYMYAFPGVNSVLNNTIFIKYTLINRNIPNPQNPTAGLWKNAYISIFNDSDLGEATDDLVGCDTLNGLAYTYNGVSSDAIYGFAPPAVGFVFLGGRVSSTQIGLNAHVSFANGSGPNSDPETGRPDHVYNFMRGLDKNGNPLGNTISGSRFMFPGDPETGSGITQTQIADQRSLLVSGPFDVTAGDTIEVIYAVTIAQGTNQFNSVTALKQNASVIRTFYNASTFASRLYAYINRGINPTVNTPFSIIIESQDANGLPRPVTQDTDVQLSLTSGSGVLTGALNGRILAGSSSVAFDSLTYSQIENGVQVIGFRTSGDNLTAALQSFNVLPAATSISIQSPSLDTFIARSPSQINVFALNPNNDIDSNYARSVTLNILNGPGNLLGDSTAQFFSGIATFNATFSRAGTYIVQAVSNLISQPFTINVRPGITAILPLLAKIPFSTESSILPHCRFFELVGLSPNTVYRYRGVTVASSNFIAPSVDGFTRFTPPYPNDLSEKFGTFTTDSEGSYKGWFITEFTASGNTTGSIQLNDGLDGSAITYTVTLAAPFSLTTFQTNFFGTNFNRSTGVIGILPATINSISTSKKVVALYEDILGAGRPLTTTYTEDDGTEPTSYPAFYQQSVNATNGRFSTLISNQSSNGIRRLELYDLNGQLISYATSSNGVWGATSTILPTGGQAQPLVIDFTSFLSSPIENIEKPKGYALMQNYPNPFNPTTVIRYQLPTAALVQLEVFDVLGRRIVSLVNSNQMAGNYAVPFNASNLASGVYFYRLQSNTFVETKKMMLLK